MLVRSHPNDPVVRVIAEECEDGAYICLPENEAQRTLYRAEPIRVFCPKDRIFKYEPGLVRRLRALAVNAPNSKELEDLWRPAKPYYEK